jgi:hypothetical protein
MKFRSGYNAAVRLKPTKPAGTAIKLEVVGNKTLPGFTDGETWTISSDDPDQEIAETIAGKFGGITALAFEVLYDTDLLETLVGHAKTEFDVEITYKDNETDTCTVVVHKCYLTNPGSTSGTANNAAPTMTITLQPRGGGKLEDCLSIT